MDFIETYFGVTNFMGIPNLVRILYNPFFRIVIQALLKPVNSPCVVRLYSHLSQRCDEYRESDQRRVITSKSTPIISSNFVLIRS